jgi:predicted RNA-binding protein with PIN domain
MGYLIDGNNLIGATPGMDLGAANARQRLLRRLADFRNLPGKRPQRITVVFDGEPEPHFPQGSSFQGVRVLYSKPDSTADAVIRELVEAQVNKRELTVVTSDRALYTYVRSCGIRATTCEQFNERLQAALESAGIEDKVDAPVDDSEIDEWMRYFGVDSAEESEEASEEEAHEDDA